MGRGFAGHFACLVAWPDATSETLDRYEPDLVWRDLSSDPVVTLIWLVVPDRPPRNIFAEEVLVARVSSLVLGGSYMVMCASEQVEGDATSRYVFRDRYVSTVQEVEPAWATLPRAARAAALKGPIAMPVATLRAVSGAGKGRVKFEEPSDVNLLAQARLALCKFDTALVRALVELLPSAVSQRPQVLCGKESRPHLFVAGMYAHGGVSMGSRAHANSSGLQ